MLDQLKRRGLTFANRCFLCQEREETIDHLPSIVQRQECFGSCSFLVLVFLGSFLLRCGRAGHPIELERVFCC